MVVNQRTEQEAFQQEKQEREDQKTIYEKTIDDQLDAQP